MGEVELMNEIVKRLLSGDTVLGIAFIAVFVGSKKIVIQLVEVLKSNTEVIAQNNELVRMLIGKGEG